MSLALCLLILAARPDFDIVVSGRIVDGTGAPWFRGDVGIKGDRIAAIGDLSKKSAAKRIDAGDRIIAPGFIDMLGQSELAVLVDNRLESKVRQGITTEVTGEGFSVAPLNDEMIAEFQPWLDKFGVKVDWRDFAGYQRRFARTKSAINFAHFVGAATARGMVLGLGDVDPTPAQLEAMKAVVDTAMKQGAVGFSTALIYPPGSYAETPELIALALAAAKHGGIYATHIRGEDEHAIAALEEAFTIGREAKIPVEIWHLKSAEKKNWGKMKDLIARIEKARAEGIDVTANMYPYAAAANGLMASVPTWAQSGGVEEMIGRFKDPAQRARIEKEIEGNALARE